MKNRTKIIGIVSAVIVFVGFYLLIIKLTSNNTKLNIVVAPSMSTIAINGKKTSSGIIKVTPGTYSVVAKLNGFSTGEQSVVVSKNETKEVDIILVSNSASTENWYTTHSSDEQIAEGISSRQDVAAASNALTVAPIIKYLPFTGPNFEYQINYGNNPGSSAVVIYITAQSQHAQLDALSWIKSQGFDPTKLTIQYINALP